MHNHEYGSAGTWSQGSNGDPDGPRPHSVLTLVLLIVGVAIAAAIGLSVLFWAFGLVFHLAGFILRVAILAAVAAFVWKRVMRRRSCTHDSHI